MAETPAAAPPAQAAASADPRQARLETQGRLRIDLRTATNVKAGKWRVLARVGEHTVDRSAATADKSTEWAPGQAGGVLGDGIKLASVIDAPLEVTIWSDEGSAGRPPVRAPDRK